MPRDDPYATSSPWSFAAQLRSYARGITIAFAPSPHLRRLLAEVRQEFFDKDR
jgi:hypothetical protein